MFRKYFRGVRNINNVMYKENLFEYILCNINENSQIEINYKILYLSKNY